MKSQENNSDTSMSSPVDSPARTSVFAVRGQASKGQGRDSGKKCTESFAKYDPATSSWRTSQLCLDGELERFSETWPRSGMTRSGSAYPLQPLVPRTDATEFGLLPTPSGTSNHGKNHVSGRLDEWGGSSNLWRGTEIGKLHCPRFEEWMMGYPDRWTELTD